MSKEKDDIFLLGLILLLVLSAVIKNSAN